MLAEHKLTIAKTSVTGPIRLASSEAEDLLELVEAAEAYRQHLRDRSSAQRIRRKKTRGDRREIRSRRRLARSSTVAVAGWLDAYRFGPEAISACYADDAVIECGSGGASDLRGVPLHGAHMQPHLKMLWVQRGSGTFGACPQLLEPLFHHLRALGATRRDVTDQREHDRLLSELSRSGRSSDPFAAAVRATRMPMLITDPHQPDNPIVFVNDAFTKLTGYTRGEILGQNCRFLQGPETDRAQVAQIRSAIERHVPIEIELLNHKKNGEIFFNRLLISPVFDEEGVLTYFFASQFDVTLERDRLVKVQDDRNALEAEVGRRNEDLRHAESKLQFVLKAGRFGTWTFDLAERRLVASEICKQNFGRVVSDPFSYDDLLASIHPADRERMEAAVAASIEDHEDYDIEYRVLMQSGEIRWVQVRGQTFYRADGMPLSMAGVSIDITERKRSEEHRALLIGELNHRVKNSMATIQSIVHQTLRLSSSLEEARSNLDGRLHSLSLAHDVLTHENWEGTTLDEVVAGALQPFRSGQGTRISMGGPHIRLSPRAALAFSMALHELATNALKYGALSTEIGRVIVNWDCEGSPPHLLWLQWEEHNGPPVKSPTRTGFGSRMIERMLVGEIGGQAKIDYRPRGIVCRIEALLESLRGSA